MEGFIVSLVIFIAVFAIFALGLNLQWGFTGLINFGHVAFMTIGAYTTVLLTLAGIPLWFAPLVGGAFAALLGLLIGLSTLRLREDYLAIVTIGVSEMIRLIAVNEEWLTRGTFGLQRFPLPLAEWEPGWLERVLMVALLTAVVGGAYWQLITWMRRSLQKYPLPVIGRGLLLALAYLASLSGLLLGVGRVSAQLKQAATLPAWAIGGLLLGALVLIGWGYLWLGRRASQTLSHWGMSLGLVAATVIAGLGLWVFRYAALALYHYSNNPSKNGLMLISVLLLVLVYVGLETLVRSPWGRVLKAIREDEEVARALGKNVFSYKLQSFMLGGFLAGIAGALYAWQLTTVFPDNFQPIVTFNAWTMVVLGGAGNNLGTILGTTIFWTYDTITRFVLSDIVPLEDSRLGAFRIMVIGLLLMVLMMWRPQGILGKKEELTLGR